MRNSTEQQRNIAHIDRLDREAACRYHRQRHRAEKNSSGRYYITGAKGSAYQKEAVELTRILKDRAVYEETDETEADFSCITTMKKAVAWLCGR